MNISTDNASIYIELADIKAAQFADSIASKKSAEDKAVIRNAFFKGFLSGLTTSVEEADNATAPKEISTPSEASSALFL